MPGSVEMSGEQAAICVRSIPTQSGHHIADTGQMVVQEVVDEGVLVSGLAPIGKTWAIYGSIPVDGEVIVAEFDSRADAESALERISAAEHGTMTP